MPQGARRECVWLVGIIPLAGERGCGEWRTVRSACNFESIAGRTPAGLQKHGIQIKEWELWNSGENELVSRRTEVIVIADSTLLLVSYEAPEVAQKEIQALAACHQRRDSEESQDRCHR